MSVPVPSGSPVVSVPWRTYRSRISYVHDGLPGEMGDEPVPFERGREWVSVSVSPDGGRVSQRIGRRPGDQGEHATSFGAHPVACDVWHLGGYEPRGVASDPVGHTAFMSSLLPNGASGPMLSTMSYGVEELGVEDVVVPAGTFTCHHYRYVFDDGHPDEHVWYTGDDLILVKIRWDLLRTTYVLTELKGDPRIGRRTPS